MPTYSYECENCGHQMDCLQKMADEPFKNCPFCGKNQLVRVIGARYFVLKGGGWYKDGYSSVSNKEDTAKSAGKKD